MQFHSVFSQLSTRLGWYVGCLWPFTRDVKTRLIRLLSLCLSCLYLSATMTAYAIPFTDDDCYVIDYLPDVINCVCTAARDIEGTTDYNKYVQVMLSTESKSTKAWYRAEGRSVFDYGAYVFWDDGDGEPYYEKTVSLDSDYSIPMYNEDGAYIRFNYAIYVNGLRKNAAYYFQNPSEDDDYFRCSTNNDGLFKEVTTGYSISDIKALRKPASNGSTSQPIEPSGHQLSVASLQTHIRSIPSGIDCKYGEGSCFHIFDQAEEVQLEVVSINNDLELTQGEYDLVWEGSAGCDKQQLLMNTHRNCLVRIYGKYDIPEIVELQNQLEFLNFSGHDLLLGGAKDLILGFILEGEGSTDVTLHADILDAGVFPKLRLNQLLKDAEGNYYGYPLTQQQHLESFTLNQTVPAGIYTLQMSSEQVLGRGLAGISLQNNTLNLTNLSVRGYLQDQLVLNFIVNGAGTQRVQIFTDIIRGDVETQLTLLNLATGETIEQADSIEVKAGVYAAILSVISGKGIGIIGVNLLK
ncbi:hypothetical protein [Candidatus Albibeggiatoa sp. nov. BB20]|uniref:hypothetical protein n=1 Tax=Candidatus Albibeggiatoa sp. nov. BB20 TaxID=3162723 RepID=UPI003365A78B